jgi:carbon-monoxide dehydrogenase catalytic subunit
MGPCRFVSSSSDERVDKGVCGARLETVVSRNLLRMAVAGAAAHSDHARDLAFTLLGVANGEINDFEIADSKKLTEIAGILEIDFQGRATNDIARDVAERLIDEFGRQRGHLSYIKRAPKSTQQRWREWGIIPKGIDREISEAIHRTHIGVDHDPDSLLLSALRVSLADGWGGSMISADISDILFGTSRTGMSDAGLGIFKPDEVNLVVIGHEPTLAKMLQQMSSDPEMIEDAKTKGAKGINIGSIFVDGYGLSSAGGFTNQELCIMTGIVEVVTVDAQCILPSLQDVANNFHTKIISTSKKAKFPGAMHIDYEVRRAREVAKEIIKVAVDNYPNRTGMGERVIEKFPTTLDASQEYFREHEKLRTLNHAIKEGTIRGIVGLVGSDNPRVQATGIHKYLAEELMREDVLILSTECASAACAGSGYLNPETASENAGPGLRKAFHEMHIPPILHMGGCSDNSKILNLLSAMAGVGDLSDEIGGLPMVIIAPEWMAEKEISIGCYFAASGLPAIFGGTSPVQSNEEVRKIMTDVWFERFKGVLHFESDYEKMFDLALHYIDKSREALSIKEDDLN